jgi:hypothetical protein
MLSQLSTPQQSAGQEDTAVALDRGVPIVAARLSGEGADFGIGYENEKMAMTSTMMHSAACGADKR